MKIYFLSSRPCALTLNDSYFGVTDRFERFAELSLKDRVFARFTPQDALPIGFFLSEELRFTPPKGCDIYLLKDGLAVYAREFPPLDRALRVIAQRRFDDVLATVFSQGELQLSVQTPSDFFIATLPPSFEQCSLSFHSDLLFIESKNALTVYALNGKCLLQERILDFSIQENTLNATLPLSDHLNRTAKCTWILAKDSCQRTDYILHTSTPTRNRSDTEKAHDELLAYAFFENVLIGADFDEMLSDELRPEKEKLRSFLGDFTAVIPTDDPNTCGLVQKKADRLYEVAYYTVKTDNKKIKDVIL